MLRRGTCSPDLSSLPPAIYSLLPIHLKPSSHLFNTPLAAMTQPVTSSDPKIQMASKETPPSPPAPPHTILGVAAIARKLHSSPMQAVLASLRKADPNLHIVEWDEHHMNRPVDQWPIVHVLLPLYSTAFPLNKVLRYIALRSPLLVNNLHMQPLMLDRRLVRRVLAHAGVPTPPAVYLDRSDGDSVAQTGPSLNNLAVYSPARCTSYTIEKPFVEKPVDPDDHNVYIYYKDGGVRKLFRKVKNLSSCYEPDVTQVRTTGDYVYEKFFEPQHHADVKVYGVGTNYFHAQTRKAPHIDGIVDRDRRGKERRQTVTLSPTEHTICTRVAKAFDQFVVGFDLLRGPGSSRFVIDVNGCSLVKNSDEYTQRCGPILAEHIRLRMHERRSLHIRALHLTHAHSSTAYGQSALVAAVAEPHADLFDNRDDPYSTPATCLV